MYILKIQVNDNLTIKKIKRKILINFNSGLQFLLRQTGSFEETEMLVKG